MGNILHASLVMLTFCIFQIKFNSKCWMKKNEIEVIVCALNMSQRFIIFLFSSLILSLPMSQVSQSASYFQLHQTVLDKNVTKKNHIILY